MLIKVQYQHLVHIQLQCQVKEEILFDQALSWASENFSLREERIQADHCCCSLCFNIIRIHQHPLPVFHHAFVSDVVVVCQPS